MPRVADSLQRYYSFNGNALASTGAFNFATSGPSVVYDAGTISAQAIDLGASNLNRCTGSIFKPQEFTCAFWFYPEGAMSNFCTVVGNMTLGALTGDWTLIGGSTTLSWYSGNNTARGSVGIIQDKWNHVAVTRSGTVGNMYIDGVIALASFNVSSSLEGDALYVGCRPDGFAPTTARIQELGFWNRKLTNTEIYQLSAERLGFNAILSSSEAAWTFRNIDEENIKIPREFDLIALDFDEQVIYDTDYASRQVTYDQVFYIGEVPSTASDGGGTNNPPLITDFSPATGSSIFATSSLRFNVVDPPSGTFADIIVMTSYSSGIYEVVHDGTQFSTAYLNSAKTPISGGFHFVLTRNEGWPESPTIKIVAIDISGSESH